MRALNIGCSDVPYSNCINMDIAPVTREIVAPGTEAPYIIPADALHLPFKDSVFDEVLMLDVLEHIKPELACLALDEVERVLKKGGFFNLSFPCNKVLSRAWEILSPMEKIALNGAYMGTQISEGQTHRIVLDVDIIDFVLRTRNVWGEILYFYSPPPTWWKCNMKARKLYEPKDFAGISCNQSPGNYGEMYKKYISYRGPSKIYVGCSGQWIERANPTDVAQLSQGV